MDSGGAIIHDVPIPARRLRRRLDSRLVALPPGGAGAARVVIALVSAERAAMLAAVLPIGTRLRALSHWTDLRAASTSSAAAVVIDPLAIDASPADLEHTLRGFAPDTPLIVYTSVTPAAMHRLLELRALGSARLILAGFDDGPAALRAAFSDTGIAPRHLRTLEALRACAGALPAEVERALTVILREEGRLSVHRLAQAAHMSARTLERRLAEAQAPPPLWLVRMARALLARELLCSSRLSVEQIARGVGYAKLGSLRTLLRWSFGSSPSSLRRGVAPRTLSP